MLPDFLDKTDTELILETLANEWPYTTESMTIKIGEDTPYTSIW